MIIAKCVRYICMVMHISMIVSLLYSAWVGIEPIGFVWALAFALNVVGFIGWKVHKPWNHSPHS